MLILHEMYTQTFFSFFSFILNFRNHNYSNRFGDSIWKKMNFESSAFFSFFFFKWNGSPTVYEANKKFKSRCCYRTVLSGGHFDHTSFIDRWFQIHILHQVVFILSGIDFICVFINLKGNDFASQENCRNRLLFSMVDKNIFELWKVQQIPITSLTFFKFSSSYENESQKRFLFKQ